MNAPEIIVRGDWPDSVPQPAGGVHKLRRFNSYYLDPLRTARNIAIGHPRLYSHHPFIADPTKTAEQNREVMQTYTTELCEELKKLDPRAMPDVIAFDHPNFAFRRNPEWMLVWHRFCSQLTAATGAIVTQYGAFTGPVLMGHPLVATDLEEHVRPIYWLNGLGQWRNERLPRTGWREFLAMYAMARSHATGPIIVWSNPDEDMPSVAQWQQMRDIIGLIDKFYEPAPVKPTSSFDRLRKAIASGVFTNIRETLASWRS